MPSNQTRRLLLVQHASDYSGSPVSGEMLACGLIKAGWAVDAAFGSEGPFVQRYAQAGCTTHIIPHKSWLRGGNLLRSGRRIAHELKESGEFVELIRRTRPQLVYINSLVSLAAAAAGWRCGLPVVWHIRELFNDVQGEMVIPACGGKPLVRWIIRRFATRIVAISRAVVDNVAGPKLGRDVIVVPNAVDDSLFNSTTTRMDARRQIDLPQDRPIIGVPGTLRPMKGHAFFLKAAAHMARRSSEVLFAVTGTGQPTYVAELHGLTQSLGLADRVRFMGNVTNMASFYRACDVLCIPSKAEPFGRTVIEAFAAGTPVVASAVGGICETIDPEITGLLVDYDDDQALARQLERLLNDVDLRSSLAKQARQKAEREYTAKVYQDRLTAIVDSLVPATVPMVAPCVGGTAVR